LIIESENEILGLFQHVVEEMLKYEFCDFWWFLGWPTRLPPTLYLLLYIVDTAKVIGLNQTYNHDRCNEG